MGKDCLYETWGCREAGNEIEVFTCPPLKCQFSNRYDTVARLDASTFFFFLFVYDSEWEEVLQNLEN